MSSWAPTSNAIAFGDFGKDSSDLLVKGFPTSGFKFIAETKTPNAIGIKTTVSGPEKLSLTVEPSSAWAATPTPDVQNSAAAWAYAIKGNYSTTSAGEISGAIGNLGLKGTKVEVVSKRDTEAAWASTVHGSFVNEYVNVKLSGTKPHGPKEPSTVNLDLVAQSPEKVYWGFNGKYSTKKDAAVELNARLQLVAPDDSYTIGVLLNHQKDSSWDLSWLWYQRITSAVKYSWSFVTNSKANTTPACVVGGEYKLDDASTFRGRVSVAKPTENAEPNFRVGLALNQTVSDHTVVTVGADVNASTFLGLKGGADHSIGFEVKLK